MATKGYHQSSEHIAKRKMFRAKNPSWKGNKVSIKAGRCRAENWFTAKPCEDCGSIKADRHHKDGNTRNNDASNIMFLCRRCHMRHDGRLNPDGSLPEYRKPYGIKNPHSKLDSANVRQIRMLIAEGMTYSAIARMFSVAPPSIRLIAIGKSYAWLK